MNTLTYHDHRLFMENVALSEVAACFGTPCFVYSQKAIETNWSAFSSALLNVPHELYYAVKANSNVSILKLFAQLGASFDIVSIGEAHRVIAAGGHTEKIIFSGIGKTEAEINEAIDLNIHCFNIESYSELMRTHELARVKKTILNIALRVNPNINPHTHAHISTGLNENKFGIPIEDIVPLAKKIKSLSYVKLIGLSSHIGSQITLLSPFTLLIDKLLSLQHALQNEGITLSYLNIGGGLGIKYHEQNVPTIEEYVHAIVQRLDQPIKIVFEPGRTLIGNAGALLTRVLYLKQLAHKNFAIVDTGMNDLLRPALYDAWHDMLPITQHDRAALPYDVVGPVCESTDCLGKDRLLAISEHDLLAITCTGAYGMSMSSNYNARPRGAEILINGEQMKLIRKRETIKEMMQNELALL